MSDPKRWFTFYAKTKKFARRLGRAGLEAPPLLSPVSRLCERLVSPALDTRKS